VKVIDVDVSRRRVSLSMRQVSGGGAPAREPEIQAEPAPQAPAGEEMAPSTIAVPQSIVDAVAEAEAQATTEPGSEAPSPASVAVEPTEPMGPGEVVEPERAAEPEPDVAPTSEPVPDAIAAPSESGAEAEETPAPGREADAAEAGTGAEGGADEEVSLEAILEDLKRREGRND
jgi:hypothetical protein